MLRRFIATRYTEEREIGSFCTTAGKNEFFGLNPDYLSDQDAGLLDREASPLPPTMEAGGVTPMFCPGGAHGSNRFCTHRCRGAVIKVAVKI